MTDQNEHNHIQDTNDEISLLQLISVLWNSKWLIIGVTALFAIASIFYALSLPNQYKASAIVAPASSDSSKNLGQLAGQFGGLASLAGINLGTSQSNDVDIAMHLLSTWEFQERFIQKHNLRVPIFASVGWDQSSNELILDEKLYDVNQKKWIREAPKGKTVVPTSWEVHEKFSKGLSVSTDIDSGLINISYTHYSPEYARNIAEWLVQEVNTVLKNQALEEAAKNIEYLENQINKTSLSGMQSVFYALIEDQIKTKMLASAGEDYVFSTVSRPMIPEEKSGPRRSIIVIAITFLGGFLVTLFVLFRTFLKVKQ